MIRLMIISLCAVANSAAAQYILNPSFEGASTCAGGCNNSSFLPWEICNFSPDLRANMSSCFNFDAPDGTYYLSLGSLGSALNVEIVGQQMSQPVISGKKYVFSGYFRDFRKNCYVGAYNTSQLIFQVYLGNDSCAMDTMALEFTVDSIESFQFIEKSFEVFKSYQYIVFATRNSENGAGTKYCLIDLVGIKEDDFTSLSGKPDSKKAQKQIIIEAR